MSTITPLCPASLILCLLPLGTFHCHLLFSSSSNRWCCMSELVYADPFPFKDFLPEWSRQWPFPSTCINWRFYLASLSLSCMLPDRVDGWLTMIDCLDDCPLGAKVWLSVMPTPGLWSPEPPWSSPVGWLVAEEAMKPFSQKHWGWNTDFP